MLDAKLESALGLIKTKIVTLVDSTSGLQQEIRKLAEAIEALTEKLDRKKEKK